MRQALYQDLGIRYPGVHVRTDSPSLENDEYAILLNEVPVTRGKIPEGYLLTNETEENLRRYNLPYITYKNASGLPSLWVEDRYRDVMEKAGIKFWRRTRSCDPPPLLFFPTKWAKNLLEFRKCARCWSSWSAPFPTWLKRLPASIPLPESSQKSSAALVQEQVSIKDLRTIMEAL